MLKAKIRAPLRKTAAIPSDSEDLKSSEENSQVCIRKTSCDKFLQENQQPMIFLSSSLFMPLVTILSLKETPLSNKTFASLDFAANKGKNIKKLTLLHVPDSASKPQPKAHPNITMTRLPMGHMCAFPPLCFLRPLLCQESTSLLLHWDSVFKTRCDQLPADWRITASRDHSCSASPQSRRERPASPGTGPRILRGRAGDPPDQGELPESLEENDEEDDEALPQGMLCGPPQCYCIVEKWRGFERILPNKTRILRLWAEWGDEQENVRFVLVRSEASLPNAGPRSAEARVVLSRERPCLVRGAPVRPSLAMTQEKQRRVVRKAFRKLASVERMETLVHLVLSQDHTIRQQVQRLRELDREIDRYEAKVHLDRMRRHGVNYVQDTYLVGVDVELDGPTPGEEPGKEAAAAAPLDSEAQAAALEELARRCDDLLQLQEQRAQQEEVLERLSTEIQEELNQRWMERRKEELAAREEPPEPDGGPDGELLLEQERVRTQLSTSLYIGLRLNTDLETVKADLDYSQQQRDSKERELQGLLRTLHNLEPTVGRDGAPSPGPPAREPRPKACAEVWVDQARGLAKSCPGNDEDSDTGLSSMHSQDSDSVPVCESLV
ncbi:Ras association domain-containing protein 10 [Heterocephalus glaber]|uniref:Ras association domain-containing protein 10 n=1 Tax=Heterocephalus glaber TaxID=10181 RepID=G5C7T2_HETGA|nr:Ras association domain-containing protein 10 [Heterocephalus glaber]